MFKKNEEVIVFPIKNGIYLHNVDLDEFYTLEEGVATYIWSQIGDEKSVDSIIDEICLITREDRNVVTNDVNEFINELLKHQMIMKI